MAETLVHADIFFFITAIAVVIITIVTCIISWYVITVVRDAKYISQKLRHATDELEEDFEALRSGITEESRKAKYIFDFFLSKLLRKGKKKADPKI